MQAMARQLLRRAKRLFYSDIFNKPFNLTAHGLNRMWCDLATESSVDNLSLDRKFGTLCKKKKKKKQRSSLPHASRVAAYHREDSLERSVENAWRAGLLLFHTRNGGGLMDLAVTFVN